MKYTKQQIRELSTLYNINLNTLLSQQKHGKQAVDLVVIKKICTDESVTLEQFNKAFNCIKNEKKVKTVMLLKLLLKEKKGIGISDEPKLNILVESDTVTWLRDGEQKVMSYENINHLTLSLDGIIEINDDLDIALLDEEKFLEAMFF